MREMTMNVKLLVSILLALCHFSANAEWIRVAATQQAVFYIDSEKSPMVGSNVMIWVLRDLKSVQFGPGLSIRSSKDQIEVDCARRKIRRIFSSDHARRMGEGKAIRSEHGPMSWNAATPNTPVSRIVGVACALSG